VDPKSAASFAKAQGFQAEFRGRILSLQSRKTHNAPRLI
jgi:hypothetical protein